MTAIYGTDTDYSALADIHLYRNLPGAGNSEYMFESGNAGQPMMDWYSWMNKVLFNTQYYSPKDRQEILQRAVRQQESDKNPDVRNNGKSNYDIISEKPYLSKFKKLLDYTGYNKIFTAPLTIFAPIDTNFDNILTYLNSLTTLSPEPKDENLPWSGASRSGWNMALNTVRYHLLPYRIMPWQLQDRKLYLQTDLEKQRILSDFTGGDNLLINPICTYQPSGP